MTDEIETVSDTDPSNVELEDYSLVNLTKLSWSQPLVASIRLHLASGSIPTALPVHPETDEAPLTTYGDDELKVILDGKSTESVSVRWSEDGNYDIAPANLVPAMQRLADDLAEYLGDRGRSGAILAVLFTELGWPVKKISEFLQVSRPTLNKWVMLHAGSALSSDEHGDLLAQLRLVRELGWAPVGVELVDVRTELLRTKRSGLSWQKATFLPTPEIADIVRALWSVSVRVRGEKSSTDDRRCSYALDMFIDMLLRRGVTAQNLGRIVGVTHAAVMHRWRRSRLWEEGDEYGSAYWRSQDEIASVATGYIDLSTTERADLRLDDPRFEGMSGSTVWHRRKSDERHSEILLSVNTRKASKVNPQPLPNVYMLCAIDGVASIDAPPIVDMDKRTDFVNALYTLDEAPTGEIVRTVRDLVSERSDIEFEPLQVSTSNIGTKFVLNDLIMDLEGGEVSRVDRMPMSPLVDPLVVSSLYDVDRHGYPTVPSHREWSDGVVLTENMLVQAVGQYNRDAGKPERPGFGDTSYHWIPSEALGTMIDLVTHEQAPDRIQELQRTDRQFNEAHLRYTISRFLPRAASALLAVWENESDWTKFDKDHYPTLLTKCLTTPDKVTASYTRPNRRSA